MHPSSPPPADTDRSSRVRDLRIRRKNRRGRPFPPGNPGRPRGATNKTTRLLAAVAAGSVSVAELTRRALGGDFAARKLIVLAILPSRPPRQDPAAVPVAFPVASSGAARANAASSMLPPAMLRSQSPTAIRRRCSTERSPDAPG
jgi:hypothetical protein